MAESIDRFIKVPDGLNLHVRIHGAENGGTPVVCLPGLTRNVLDFEDLARMLAAPPNDRRIIAISSRGRGVSDRDPKPERYTIPVEAGDVISVLDALGIDDAAFIGTSRGGLILHVLAMTHLNRIERLVLNDIGPVLETEGLRQIQGYLGNRPVLASYAEAADILKATHGAEFPALGPDDWAGMARALYREIDGKLAADFDPDIAAQFRAADLSQPFPDLWAQFALFADKKVMVIRGEHSRLLSRATTDEMARRHSGCTIVEAKGQGHAPLLHLDGLAEAIGVFLGS
ncbi:hydrolase [Agrobacterium albertimagni AOL15]|uniref:Hydrolase n=1 Tax=Agrobacterium albertimagni AOL15 TaxID=1156935 RepID=K2QBA3_9HYPH|nr:alpha/beta hydrolase [Agrobacterium albertimagni]EKF58286.1 hydrolase [Agrobacterium albertimagni AOL15]